MQVLLVFADWRDKSHQSVYQTEKGIDLSMGDFHSGTTFKAEIVLDADAENDLRDALRDDFIPVFYVTSPNPKEPTTHAG